MRYNEDWLINQYQKRIEIYQELKINNASNPNELRKLRALIIATEEFIKDLKDLKESRDESI
jgi:hypothetical protein